MDTTNKRVISFDLLKAFGIFLVIWGHSIAFLSSSCSDTNHCFLIIYSFHMPLFMMMSGYFYAGKVSLYTFSELLKNKSIHLLLPAILWGVVIASFGFLNHLYKGESDLHLKVVNSLFLSLWFLKCLFLCYVFAKLANNNVYGYILTLCLSQFLPIWKFEIMYPCFIAGFLLKHYFNVIRQNSLVVMILLLISFSYTYVCLWDADMLKTHFLFIEQDSVFGTLYVRLVRICIGIVGSSFLILLFDKLFNSSSNHEKSLGGAVSSIGKETLGIYILQDIIVVGLISKIPGIRIFDEYLFSLVIAPVFSLIVLLICYKIVRIIKRNDRAAFYLLGVRG